LKEKEISAGEGSANLENDIGVHMGNRGKTSSLSEQTVGD
jgi:hypothetical protein